MENRTYIAIDLKSFYASVECVERGLDPMTANLVVADISRTEKTICLAVSPSLKAYGISGRPRLFEVIQKIREINAQRLENIPNKIFAGSSFIDNELKKFPELSLNYIIAPPQMSHYMEISSKIYRIYLKYIAPEDIHVYSIDEVMIDATSYLHIYGMTGRELARTIILDVLHTTGITATAGVGTNLYLCKIAMDIVAKHISADQDGVRIAELNEMSYRRLLWNHRPLTDFWRVGRGYARRLEAQGLYTMGDIARCSVGKESDYYNEDLLYGMFGINAELLIDHAWGYEPCTMEDIKAYKPENNSVGSAQVLHCPYPFEKARVVVREMADMLALDLVEKKLVTDQIILKIGYDSTNLKNPELDYKGKIRNDRYGRKMPEHAHGTVNLKIYSSSCSEITAAATDLYEQISDKKMLIRRISITANHVVSEKSIHKEPVFEQMELFTDYNKKSNEIKKREEELERERKIQNAVIEIKRKYGKNAVLKGMSLQKGATARDRNNQIGGHRA